MDHCAPEEEQIRQLFQSVWPSLIHNLQTDKRFKGIPDSVLQWMTNVLAKNVPKGKQIRGLAVVHMFCALKPTATTEEIKLACVLGWCCEIFQACCLIADDIMDSSETRRGEPCWYKQNHVGLSAINDSFMLENIMYQILRKYFQGADTYFELLGLFQDTAMFTIFGQSLDTRISIERDATKFDAEHYKAIATFKTGFYTFYCPVAAALILAGYSSELLHLVKPIMLNFGLVFQIQDDYLDCFGDPKVTGKVGTDIVDCKCTWLMVRALELCTESQKKILLASIEQPPPTKWPPSKEIVESVKEIFTELNLKTEFKEYEESACQQIANDLFELHLSNSSLPLSPFLRLLAMIYQRQK